MKDFGVRNDLHLGYWQALIFHFSLFTLLFFGCASTEVYVVRRDAIKQLNQANQYASRGRYDDALQELEKARLIAVSTDDPELRLRTSIIQGDILFSMGKHEEAFEEWENASEEGDAFKEWEKATKKGFFSDKPVLASLAALARIYKIRARLLMPADETGDTKAVVEEYKKQINKEMPAFKTFIKKDYEISRAVAFVTLGLAEKALGNFKEAEDAVKKALKIHTKKRNNMLEDAAYDWFLIASIRSVDGKYDKALEALRKSIDFDRYAENSLGIASSWEYMGNVYEKMGQTEKAQEARQRAADIYQAMR